MRDELGLDLDVLDDDARMPPNSVPVTARVYFSTGSMSRSRAITDAFTVSGGMSFASFSAASA